MDTTDLKNGLAGFYGTEQWYRHDLNRNMLYTDGVKFFAENAGGGAYWFLDIVATEVFPMLKDNPFIAVMMDVEGNKCRIIATDGDESTIFERKIDYTDCPAGEWRFFLTDNVLLLPSEY